MFCPRRVGTASLAVLSCWFLVVLASPAFAGTAGTLDTSFGGDGKVTTNFTSGDDLGLGVAIQPSDGKIVVAGGARGSGGTFALARYNLDGTLDAGFSGDGRLTTNFTPGRDFAAAVAIQADGKIVAAGTANFSGNATFALARYEADGTLDTSFDGDGKVTTDLTGSFDAIYGLVIQPGDGKIVAVGAAGSSGDFALARYGTTGALDTSFRGDGIVITSITGGYDFADDVAVQPADGKIVAAGAANYFGRDPRFALARYNTDGTLDAGFSGDGKVTTNFTGGDDYAFGVAIQPADGKIVAAGGAGGSGGRFALARYTTTGALDTTFNADGRATTDFTGGYDYADDVVVQSNGKIVTVGASNAFGGNPAFGLARHDTDGTVDTSFGGDGRVITNFTSKADFGVAAGIQQDGKIVVAGRGAGSGGRFAVARYLAA